MVKMVLEQMPTPLPSQTAVEFGKKLLKFLDMLTSRTGKIALRRFQGSKKKISGCGPDFWSLLTMTSLKPSRSDPREDVAQVMRRRPGLAWVNVHLL